MNLKSRPLNKSLNWLFNIVRGFYAWRQKPKSSRQCRDEHHQSLIKHSWLESGSVYGYRKVWLDLLAMGEPIGRNRVARLMRLANLKL